MEMGDNNLKSSFWVPNEGSRRGHEMFHNSEPILCHTVERGSVGRVAIGGDTGEVDTVVGQESARSGQQCRLQITDGNQGADETG